MAKTEILFHRREAGLRAGDGEEDLSADYTDYAELEKNVTKSVPLAIEVGLTQEILCVIGVIGG
ncbi:MAG TPA: hypothetical protein VI306_23805 [Pyrinomonadaceae bacterium]